MGVFQPGREQLARRQQLDLLHQVGDVAGVVDDHLMGQLLPQIGKFLQHLGGGFEVDGQRRVGVGELLAGQKDMAVGLVLRLLEVDVAGGADGLVQLPAQADDGAVELPQLLLRLDVAVAEHEHIVADGLYFQIVVKRRDAPELGPVLVVLHRLEQLPGLAGGADDEPLPVGHQLGFGDDGHPLEVLQVGGGDQLVQVLEAHFVLGQQDDVFGKAAGLAAPGPQLQHLGVDVLEAADAQFFFHLLEKRDQHIGHHGRVIGSPVVVEGGQVQILGHNVQLELVQLRQEILGQDQGVHIGGVEGKPLPAAAGPDEADVELGVVGRQGAAVHKGQKGRQGLLGGGGTGKHGVGDAGEADDLRRQAAAGIHEGLEAVGDLAVLQHHGADLGDGLPVHLQAGGLDIEADDLVGEVLVLGTVDGDAVVQIVDEIALYAVENFNFALGGVPGVREGLGHAVVGDGDGRVAPGDGLLDDGGGVRQGVHVGHLGVEVQLHPLLRGGVLPGLVGDLHDVEGAQLNVLAVPAQLHIALDPEPHARGHGVLHGLGLLALHVLGDGDGIPVIRHVEGQTPDTGLAGLVALGGKDLALHHHGTHLGVQTVDGDGLALDLPAHEDVGPVICALGGAEAQAQLAQVVLVHQQLAQGSDGGLRQGGGGRQLQLHGALRPVHAAAHHAGVVEQQAQVPGRHKALEKGEKRYFIAHTGPSLTACRSRPSGRPPSCPGGPCAEFRHGGTAGPRRRRRRCPHRRPGPRRGR